MAVAISWSADFETGIDIIDAQHKRIFEYLREIDHAIHELNEVVVGEVVNALIDYSISHNTFEESLMEKAGYPMLDPHRRVHEAFKARALAYSERLGKGEDHFRVGREVRADIGLWLTNHIKRDDKHYAPFVKKSLDGSFAAKMISKFFGRRHA